MEEEYDFTEMSLKDLNDLKSLTERAIQQYTLSLQHPGATESEKWQFERCIFYTDLDLKKIETEIQLRITKEELSKTK